MGAETPAGIGASVRRKEDYRLLTGSGQYIADIRLPGATHAAILRSSHAHARIRQVDTVIARQAPGVVLVLSGRDLATVLRPIPMRLSPLSELARALQLPLAVDRVRYVGEPVAVVVAEDRYRAEDALDLIEVEYDALPAVTSAQGGMAQEAPLLHPSVGSNVVAEFETGRGDLAAAFAAADLVVTERFATQRHGGVPLETRGLQAAWDHGRLTVWGPTKVPHFNRGVLADLLGLPESAIRFLEPDVGGGFGVRGEFYPEDFLIPYLARQVGQPVVWIEDRIEHLRASNHSRQQEHLAQLAVSRDGRILGLRDELLCDMGAYVRTHGATVPSLTAAMLPGPYEISAYHCRVRCVLTNKTPTGTYRGPGRFEAAFVRERLIDLAAEKLGLDPAEMRRRNLVKPAGMPYDVGTKALGVPTIYDSGDYPALLERGLAQFDYLGARAEQARARAEGRLVGLGLGYFVEKSGLGPWEYARLEVEANGSFTLYTGCASIGQGMETALAQICGDVLGVGPESISVVHGDTDRVPRGGGAFASRGTVMAGASAFRAAEAVRYRLLERASNWLEASAVDLELRGGRVTVRGLPERGIAMSDLLWSLDGSWEPVIEEALFETTHMAYPYGLHLTMVELDPETGRITILRYVVAYDVGRAVNPLLVDGQIIGGLGQGVGGALLEEFAYDAEGQLLTSSFVDYLLPTALEVPTVEVALSEDAPSPLNPLGVKGAGEGGTVGASAALANAVADAIRPLGRSVQDLPLTPERITRLLRRTPPD